ncbi:MAG: hydroxyacid dehydrogenase, partial [Clostridia bacterium]|nr:hydroxyacid dehydrogenase [Clostridia bacterium]
FDVVIAPDPSEETIKSLIVDADAFLVRATKVNENILSAAKKLKIVSRHGVGLDQIDVEACTKHGVIVTVTTAANAHSVAEHTLGGALYLMKRYEKAQALLRSGACNMPGGLTGILTKLGFSNEVLEGKTICLVGCGAIARYVAHIAHDGFGMNVIGYDPFVSAENLAASGIKKYETVDEMLPLSDVVSIHVPKMPETVNLINKSSFEKMKKNAVLINTARGGIVNEADLAEALNSGKIAGAMLDVFEVEPPKLDNPLFSCENVLLTPHIAAASDGAMMNMSSGAAKNIIDFFNGAEILPVVNKQVFTPFKG